MKVMARISGIDSTATGHELFAKLVEILPEGSDAKQSQFNCQLFEDDRRLVAILELLRINRFLPAHEATDSTEPRRIFRLFYNRFYEDHDLQVADLLCMYPRRKYFSMRGPSHDAHGYIQISSVDAAHFEELAILERHDGEVVMSEQVRAFIGILKLPEVTFREITLLNEHTVAGDKNINCEVPGWPWWEFGTTATMPLLAPTVLKFGYDRKLLPREATETTLLKDDPKFHDCEFHFLRTEIERMGRFDVARTAECWLRKPHFRRLVVSRRFYQVCKTNSIDCGWTPVRIDND